MDWRARSFGDAVRGIQQRIGGRQMIVGAHTILYSRDAEATRDFFRDVLGYDHVDAGDGWLIFRLPPGELAVHPAEDAGHHELYLMCDELDATIAELTAKGVEISQPISDEGWGLLTQIRLPDGSELGLYEPRHPTAI